MGAEMMQRVLQGETLDATSAEAAFDRFMSGEASDVEMATLLTALKVRGETPGEVAGGVRALRKAMIPLAVDGDDVIDTCGTGGGTLTTFNISTAAALVAVGGGVRIAKHGNRSFTSKCGSADVLEMLGVSIELEPADEARMFEETGFVFMFAPAHHPAMRHVGPIRAALGVTTIMNLLGPLANPAGVRRQVVGVAHPSLQQLVADALLELGHVRAMVVHGAPGMDELSPLGPTRVLQVENGTLDDYTVDPSDLGWPTYEAPDLAGGEPPENAERVRAVLSGEAGGAARAAVVLNAGAAFWAAGHVDSLEAGIARAESSIDDGSATRTLEALAAFA